MLFVVFSLASHSHAQSPLVTIDMVTVGDAGNAADTTGYGAVADVFAIGKYEVTIGQYTAFLNSVARTNTNSYIVNLWNASMATDLNIAGISRSGSGTLASPYSYSVIGPSGITLAGASSPGNRPITYVSWFDAARFANWINNGATNGASTETGAYTLNGATSGIITKNAGATWWIPSEDAWYKAAYYKSGGTNAGYWLYPTQSDDRPGNMLDEFAQLFFGFSGATNQANFKTGVYAVTWTVGVGSSNSSYSSTQNYLTEAGVFSNSGSAYGTFDQAGSVWEWNDAVTGSSRGLRGGSWDYAGWSYLQSSNSLNADPSGESGTLGFRVASLSAAPVPVTNVILTVEKTINLSGQWQLAPITSNMITPAGELDLGAMTNASEFYRLKIRTVVE